MMPLPVFTAVHLAVSLRIGGRFMARNDRVSR
jgi:hypothetical protein